MLRREVPLHTGLTIGDRLVKAVVIREGVLGDELAALESGAASRLALDLRIDMRRVAALGGIDTPVLTDPEPEIVARLSNADWALIATALAAMDIEIFEAAGLPVPEHLRGREQPGGEPGPDADPDRGSQPVSAGVEPH